MDLSNDKNVFSGKTVEEATETGLKVLGITEEDAQIEIIEQGKKGIFKNVPAQVRIIRKTTDAAKAAEFIDGLLEIMGITGFCEVNEADATPDAADEDRAEIEINIKTTNARDVVGRRGETIDAVQTLAGAVANMGLDEYKKVTVDCDGYRAKRKESLNALALNRARKAVETGRKVPLEPMNPYERRVIHFALADNPDVKTVSDGKEPNRHVVIIPNNLRPSRPYGQGGSGNGRGNQGRGRGGNGHGQQGGRMFNRDKRLMEQRENSSRGSQQHGQQHSSPRPSQPRGKKEMHFESTFLGNSKDQKDPETDD